MYIVHVHIMLNPSIEAFIKRHQRKCQKSTGNEPGVARFDVLQQADDPTRFF